MSDGKMRQGFWYHAIGIPLVLCFNEQFCRIMAAIPETAPEGENHLLQTTSMLQRIVYRRGLVVYRTLGESSDVLKVIDEPKSVTAGGRALKRAAISGQGWSYDPDTAILRVNHEHPEVEIRF